PWSPGAPIGHEERLPWEPSFPEQRGSRPLWRPKGRWTNSRSALPRVAIIGAGMSGLAMARRLRAAGSENFVVFEKASSVGGTWRENTYPGLACDVPAHYYCYRDKLGPGWTRMFAPGEEIKSSFEDVATSE